MVPFNESWPLVVSLFRTCPQMRAFGYNYHWIQVNQDEPMSTPLLSVYLSTISKTSQNVSTVVLLIEPNILSDDELMETELQVKLKWPRAQQTIIRSVTDMALDLIKDTKQIKLALFAEGIKVSTVAVHGLVRHQFSDVRISPGSSYSLGLSAIQAACKEYQKIGHSNLLQDITCHLQLTSIAQAAQWAERASQSEIASLSQLILNSTELISDQVIYETADVLSRDLIWSLNSLSHSVSQPNQPSCELHLIGDQFKHGTRLSHLIAGKINVKFPHIKLTVKAMSVDELVREVLQPAASSQAHTKAFYSLAVEQKLNDYQSCKVRQNVMPLATGLPPTEARNNRSTHLDTMPLNNAIELMVNDQISGLTQLLSHRQPIEQLIEVITVALRSGSKLFYVGAGTSGRLGLLDAVECASTFSCPRELVQGILAGGAAGMFEPVASCEDSFEDGCSVGRKKLTSGDIIIGISASGLTPFVWGALFAARSIKCFTALVTFNGNVDFKLKPDLVLQFNVGSEVLTGSTRLKCGTTTKCLLDIISTLSMVKMGKCIENLMVEVDADNIKLKERATRIVVALCEQPLSEGKCRRALEMNMFDIRKTVRQLNLIEE